MFKVINQLRFEGITCNYGFAGGRKVGGVPPQTFSLDPGIPRILCGGNGKGKTSLLHTIIGAVPSSSGDVTILEEGVQGERTVPIESFLEDSGLRFFLLPQDPKGILPVEMCVSTAIEMWRRVGGCTNLLRDHDCIPLEVREMIGRLSHTHCSNLSGGEAQVLGLILGLLWDPDVVLLDEPTAAVGQIWRENVIELIRALSSSKSKQRFVLIATHDQALLQQLDANPISLSP